MGAQGGHRTHSLTYSLSSLSVSNFVVVRSSSLFVAVRRRSSPFVVVRSSFVVVRSSFVVVAVRRRSLSVVLFSLLLSPSFYFVVVRCRFQSLFIMVVVVVAVVVVDCNISCRLCWRPRPSSVNGTSVFSWRLPGQCWCVFLKVPAQAAPRMVDRPT
mgnify:CR=1 FL=1